MSSLKELAINLESVAKKYSLQDEEAKKLLESLEGMIYRAKNGMKIGTEERVPGFHWFSEGGLSQYRDLEKAYSQFSIFVAAGTNEQYEKMLKAIDDSLK